MSVTWRDRIATLMDDIDTAHLDGDLERVDEYAQQLTDALRDAGYDVVTRFRA